MEVLLKESVSVSNHQLDCSNPPTLSVSPLAGAPRQGVIFRVAARKLTPFLDTIAAMTLSSSLELSLGSSRQTDALLRVL